jgi:hypothetical protein
MTKIVVEDWPQPTKKQEREEDVQVESRHMMKENFKQLMNKPGKGLLKRAIGPKK